MGSFWAKIAQLKSQAMNLAFTYSLILVEGLQKYQSSKLQEGQKKFYRISQVRVCWCRICPSWQFLFQLSALTSSIFAARWPKSMQKKWGTFLHFEVTYTAGNNLPQIQSFKPKIHKKEQMFKRYELILTRVPFWTIHPMFVWFYIIIFLWWSQQLDHLLQ